MPDLSFPDCSALSWNEQNSMARSLGGHTDSWEHLLSYPCLKPGNCWSVSRKMKPIKETSFFCPSSFFPSFPPTFPSLLFSLPFSSLFLHFSCPSLLSPFFLPWTELGKEELTKRRVAGRGGALGLKAFLPKAENTSEATLHLPNLVPLRFPLH